MIKDVVVTNLKIINTPDGEVMHAIKRNEDEFKSFGEVYFSNIKKS